MGFVANRLNEFDKGRWFIANLQWIATLAILFKVYGMENYLILGTIVLVFGTWICGVFIIKSGIWAAFTRATNAGLKEWFKKQ